MESEGTLPSPHYSKWSNTTEVGAEKRVRELHLKQFSYNSY